MMLEKNDLLAIAELLNSSLEANNKVLTKRMDQMDSAIQGNQAVLTNRMDQMDSTIHENHAVLTNRMDQMDSTIHENHAVLTNRMDQMDSAIHENQTEIRQTRVLIENQSHSIRLIAEQHGEIINRLPAVEEQASLKSRVQVLETVVVQLRTEMESLRKAN